MSRILITIPCWNEASIIERSLATLGDACAHLLSDHDVTIEVVDNGSSDGTSDVARRFIEQHPHASNRKNSLITTTTPGKGLAVATSWLAHREDADVFVFVDADLAANLNALPALVRPILNGEADLVCGSRFLPGADVERKASRELASRAYRVLQRRILRLPVQDAQCGFKAASARLVRDVVSHCEETGWMFDSELIARTAKSGLAVAEIPVSWIEHRDPSRRSALSLWMHGWGFVSGLVRIKKRLGRISS
ncbi:MAG TPA: glycosyltransferase [Candidatus Methylomirabilis sp.]|nr:glycosyltransferase [Candidatus Methylomirabilis sp.]